MSCVASQSGGDRQLSPVVHCSLHAYAELIVAGISVCLFDVVTSVDRHQISNGVLCISC